VKKRLQQFSRKKLKMNDPVLIIDGFNVLHAVVLVGRDRAGWWHPTAQRRLVERIEQLDIAYPSIWIVFDRRSSTGKVTENVTSDDPRIEVMYAPSADDWIVAEVERLSPRHTVTVVTADRPLRERVRRAGGSGFSPLAVFGRK
jgi:predicted RNA-binding protein with PIN domain